MRPVVVLFVLLGSALCVSALNPITPAEVPKGWSEPEYSKEPAEGHRFTEQLPASSGSAGGMGTMYPATVIPGPWFGSYSTRMDSMGYTVPPYAFDPATFQKLGPYRALTNTYSDGTVYPLDLKKFDSFPYDSNGAFVAGGH